MNTLLNKSFRVIIIAALAVASVACAPTNSTFDTNVDFDYSQTSQTNATPLYDY